MRKLIVSGLLALAAAAATAGAASGGSAAQGPDRAGRVVVADTGWGSSHDCGRPVCAVAPAPTSTTTH